MTQLRWFSTMAVGALAVVPAALRVQPAGVAAMTETIYYVAATGSDSRGVSNDPSRPG